MVNSKMSISRHHQHLLAIIPVSSVFDSHVLQSVWVVECNHSCLSFSIVSIYYICNAMHSCLFTEGGSCFICFLFVYESDFVLPCPSQWLRNWTKLLQLVPARSWCSVHVAICGPLPHSHHIRRQRCPCPRARDALHQQLASSDSLSPHNQSISQAAASGYQWWFSRSLDAKLTFCVLLMINF